MDASLFQPLTVDCRMEYELDMNRFPGWDDPLTRAQPALMFHLPDSCTCDCELRIDTNSCSSPSEEELSSILDEFDLLCYENDDVLQVSGDCRPSPLVAAQTVDGPIHFDPYISGPVSHSPLSSIWLSSSSASSGDLDFLLISPNSPDTKEPWQPTSSRKRKHSETFDEPAAKRQRYHGNDDFYELLAATFTRGMLVPKVSDEDKTYSFHTGIRD